MILASWDRYCLRLSS